jgi:hypothetical protein
MGIVKSTRNMSWLIYAKGTPEEVVETLEKQGAFYKEGDQSGEEFNAALPHIIALVKENIGGVINLSAWGHGAKDVEGKFYDKNCQVNIVR